MDAFVERFLALPLGYGTGHYGTTRYGTTISASPDGRRRKLYAEELGGNDHVSFNLYISKSGEALLKPCEMREDKVIDFVLNYRPDPGD